jgi:hypothetical protein
LLLKLAKKQKSPNAVRYFIILNFIQMKKIIFIPGILFFLLSCYSSISQKNIILDEHVGKFKGRIKSITEIEYSAEEKLGQIQRGEKLDSSSYIFNKSGNLIQINTYDSNGELKYKTNLFYNDKGLRLNLIERTLKGVFIKNALSNMIAKGI